MTDKEIIKALECCYTNNSDDCYKCPYEGESTAQMFCDKKLTRDALDLINRLQAENERLQKTIDKLKFDMSYMSSPNAIGDKHEMGCW